MTKQENAPFALRRIALPDYEKYSETLNSAYQKLGAKFVFELYDVRTNEPVDWQESPTPFCPKRLLKVQRQFNSQHVMNHLGVS